MTKDKCKKNAFFFICSGFKSLASVALFLFCLLKYVMLLLIVGRVGYIFKIARRSSSGNFSMA